MMNDRVPAYETLGEYDVLPPERVNAMPKWSSKRLYPPSHMLRVELREVLRPFLSDESDYTWACDRYEYRVAVVKFAQARAYGPPRAYPGEFILERRWSDDGKPFTEVEFAAVAQQADDTWPWWPYLGGREGIDATIVALRKHLHSMRRWG